MIAFVHSMFQSSTQKCAGHAALCSAAASMRWSYLFEEGGSTQNSTCSSRMFCLRSQPLSSSSRVLMKHHHLSTS